MLARSDAFWLLQPCASVGFYPITGKPLSDSWNSALRGPQGWQGDTAPEELSLELCRKGWHFYWVAVESQECLQQQRLYIGLPTTPGALPEATSQGAHNTLGGAFCGCGSSGVVAELIKTKEYKAT